MPSDIVQFTLVLPQSRKKQSVVLNGLTFKDGEATVRGDAKEIAGVVKYFTRSSINTTCDCHLMVFRTKSWR